MRERDKVSSDGNSGGRSSYSLSLSDPNYKNAYQKALSKETKNKLKTGLYDDYNRDHIGTWDDETQEYYYQGKRVDYGNPRSAFDRTASKVNNFASKIMDPYMLKQYDRTLLTKTFRDDLMNNPDILKYIQSDDIRQQWQRAQNYNFKMGAMEPDKTTPLADRFNRERKK